MGVPQNPGGLHARPVGDNVPVDSNNSLDDIRLSARLARRRRRRRCNQLDPIVRRLRFRRSIIVAFQPRRRHVTDSWTRPSGAGNGRKLYGDDTDT